MRVVFVYSGSEIVIFSVLVMNIIVRFTLVILTCFSLRSLPEIFWYSIFFLKCRALMRLRCVLSRRIVSGEFLCLYWNHAALMIMAEACCRIFCRSASMKKLSMQYSSYVSCRYLDRIVTEIPMKNIPEKPVSTEMSLLAGLTGYMSP